MDVGVDEIHKLFGQKSWIIDLKGTDIKLEVESLDLKTNTLSVNGHLKDYQLQRWQALNVENYKKYQALSSMVEKIQMLERILTGNILSFAKGIDWRIEEKITVKISDLQSINPSRMKDIKVSAFDVTFQCNVVMPNWMGLGKGASTGFGVINEIKK